MWIEFYFAAFACALCLYVPGFLVLRGLGVPRAEAVGCAPFASIVPMSLLTILYAKLGIFCTWMTVVLPVAAVGVLLIVLRKACCGKLIGARGLPCSEIATALGTAENHSRQECVILSGYVIAGVLVSSCVFVGSLADPNGFVQEFDNIHHLGITRAFLDSGNWSPLNVVLYATSEDWLINPLPEPTYYPAAWNMLAAVAAQVSGIGVPAAVNAANFIVCAVILPVSMWCFMRVVFGKQSMLVIAFGALVCPAFTMFPWAFLVYGPLYPNALGIALLPAMMALFISVFEGGVSAKARVVRSMLVLVSVVSCAFTQPNAVFSAVVLLAPFLVYRVVQGIGGLPRFAPIASQMRVTVGIATTIAVVLVWTFLFNLPFFQGVVNYTWPAFRSLDAALADVGSGSFRLDVPQTLLMLCVLAGALTTLYKRHYLWITLAFALTSLIYVVDASSDGFLKHYLSGFWYTDTLRVAAFLTIAAVSLASLGLWAVARSVGSLLGKLSSASGWQTFNRIGIPLLVALAIVPSVYNASLLASLVFSHGEDTDLVHNALTDAKIGEGGSLLQPAFASMVATLADMNNPYANNVYDSDERAFIQEVKQVVPEGALIINVPDDGSAFAYSVDGLNIYYRYLRTYGVDFETSDSRLIRNGLVDIADRPDVLEAVRDIGAEYVMLLDQGTDDNSVRPRRYLFTYENGANFQGILAIGDNTPGFEVVLSEGDMCLYRISVLD